MRAGALGACVGCRRRISLALMFRMMLRGAGARVVLCLAILFGLLLASGIAFAATGEPPVAIHGFVSQGYLKSDGNNFHARSKRGTWAFTEFGLNFTTEASDDLRVGMQIFSRQFGPLGNLKLELDWAFADYSYSDAVGLRLGRVKMPYGLYGEVRDIDIVFPSALPPQSVYFIAMRDLLVSLDGLSMYGSLNLGVAGGFNYQLFGGTALGPPGGPDSSVARFFNNKAAQPTGKDPVFKTRKAIAHWLAGGALQWDTPFSGLLLGGTWVRYQGRLIADLNDSFVDKLVTAGMWGPWFSREQRFEIRDADFWVGSLEYTVGDFILAAEYTRWTADFESNNVPLIPDAKLDQERYYAQLSYRLSELLQVAAYYSVQESPDDPDGTESKKSGLTRHKAWMRDAALSLRVDLTERWLLKLEGHRIDGTAMLYEIDNVGRGGKLARMWSMFVAKTSIAF